MTIPRPRTPRTPKTPPKLLAVDPGSRRVGIALSDDLGLLAHPRSAVAGGEGAVASIAAIVRDEEVDEVIVGLPISLSGRDSDETRRARDFARRLRDALDVPVSEWDERFSSAEAERHVKGKRRRSGALDSAAAAVVLQSVLDARRGGSR